MAAPRRSIFVPDARFAFSAPAAGRTGPGTLAGYAIAWNTPNTDGDRRGFTVVLKPGSARFDTPTLALFNHDRNSILGNTANGSLRLQSDQTGVKFEMDLPDTQLGRDVAALVRDGYVKGMSFFMASEPKGVSRTTAAGTVFEVSDFLLDEITVTATPAFSNTSVDNVSPPPAGAQPGPRLAASAAPSAHRTRFDQLRLAALTLPPAPGAKP